MTDTAARLLALLTLLQLPREWPGSELARRLDVTPRTIRRDVDRLRELGYPVAATRGSDGGYRLVAGTAMPPLLLDDEEAVAIAVGLRTAATQAVTGIDEASVRALAKLEQVLPSRLRRRVGVLGAAVVPVPGTAPPVDPAHLTLLSTAIANRERARLRYRSHGGVPSRRHVEPHRLVVIGRRWYLVAFDLDREDWRTFRMDRVTEPVTTGARSTVADLPDAAEHLLASLYRSAPTCIADVTLHAPAAAITGRFGDTPADVEIVDERTCRVRRHTDTPDWIASRLIGLGCDFIVHGPPELLTHLRTLSERVARAVTAS
ncbi:helix-turn-helix transcriptional regulator [Pseudonocardia sp. GCM10023141]|uniref:helix-turn-helix transcriptional regulator n=1 Tax=Pseudonocardia sp. GCM10023141 TaxID=3252653 RepID=UPI003622DD18